MTDVLYLNPEIRPVTYPGIKENKYMITEYGHVIDTENQHVLRPFKNSYGYLQYRMQSENGTMFHPTVSRLVAYEFVPENRDLSKQVDHVDANKLNNHYSNLDWVSNLENIQRAYQKKLLPIKSYKSNEQITNVCELLSTTDYTFSEVCRQAGLELNDTQAKSLCSDIIQRKYWNEISSNYDFTNRTSKRHVLSSTKHDQLVKLKGLPTEKIYEEFTGKDWPNADRKERDRFRQLLKRHT